MANKLGSNGQTSDKYFNELIVATDEIRLAMDALDIAIKRLEGALAEHLELREELNDGQ